MQDYVTDYEEAVEYLCRIPRFNSTHSLDKIKYFLTRMGQPDRQMKIVHIAGTNGKGSTSAYLAGLLECAGKKTGLFTSPHLTDIRERFRINGSMISKELWVEAVQYIQKLLEQSEQEYTPCFFDVLFLAGMYIFQKEQVEILVLETGLGGRLDATNAVQDKALTLITHIALDHTEYLGDTVEQIAEEKAGIMRAGVPCIVAAHNEETAHIFLKKAEELGGTCRILGEEVCICQRVYEKSVAFSYFSSYYGTVPITLKTSALYQTENVCLALAGFEKLIETGIVQKEAVTREALQETLRDTTWEGRMEEISDGIFLDGAHNEDGIAAFLSSVRQDGCKGRRILIFSAVSDKNIKVMAEELMRSALFDAIILTQIANARGMSAAALAALFESDRDKLYIEQAPAEALSLAKRLKRQEDYIYATGSLYLVGQMKMEGELT